MLLTLVKKVPINLAEEAVKEKPDTFEIVSDTSIDEESLMKEKAALIKRINEINKILGIED